MSGGVPSTDAKKAYTPEEWLALNDELVTTKAALAVSNTHRDTLKEELDSLKAHPGVKAALEEEARVKVLIAGGLHAASEKGCVEAVKELIAVGAGVNQARTDDGYAPLHLALCGRPRGHAALSTCSLRRRLM